MYEENKKALEALEALKAELEQRLDNLQKDIGKSHSRDSGEQAVERENDEVVMGLRDETKLELAQINTALKKIQLGMYGQCGKTIKPQRLAVLPYSLLCVECASAA